MTIRDVLYVADRPSQLDVAGLDALANAGYGVRVVYTEVANWSNIDTEIDRVIEWPSKPSAEVQFCNGSAYTTFEFVKAAARDIVIVNGYSTRSLAAALWAVRGAPAVVLRSDNVRGHRAALQPLKRGMYRMLLMSGGYAAATSSGAARYLVEVGFPRDKILNMPYLLAPEVHAIGSDVVSKEALVVAACKFTEREGFDRVWRVFLYAAEALPEVNFVILGDGPVRPSAIKLPANLSMPGHLQFTKYLKVLTKARVFVHLPRVEPWGASIVEAIALRTRVVASTATGSGQELLRGSALGRLIDDHQWPQTTASQVLAEYELALRGEGAEAERRRVLEQYSGPSWIRALEVFAGQ